MVFRLPESGAALVLASLLLLLLWLLLALLRRAPAGLLLALGVSALLLGFALPRAFSALLISKISQTYDLSVDHRPRPDGREINRDGVRFKGDASDLSDDDFVVLFLGDSFTFGIGLRYHETYPVQFKAIASAAACVERVRAVNFGWISSSPLLSLRLLREIGYRYRPDLLVYNLDMTDFHDDLRYEYRLRRERDFEVDRRDISSGWSSRSGRSLRRWREDSSL